MVTRILLVLAVTASLDAARINSPKFYPDDPLPREPRPSHVASAKKRKLSDYYDLFSHTLATPGQRQKPGQEIRSQSVNTIDEVPDSAWYTNRHYRRPMSTEELQRGPGLSNAPSTDGAWKILAAKTEGVTPGFLVRDSRNQRYFIKFDPVTNPEMATAADVIGSKFFHALGYHVPENYVVTFMRSQLGIDPKATVTGADGKERSISSIDVDEILRRVPQDSDHRYRATASLFLPGSPLGPFRYNGTRSDDPNDIVPHEHRRELRGLFVFAAWLGHDDSRSINTLDMLVKDDEGQYVKHHLIDFGSILGSASDKSNSARSGYEQLFSLKPALKEIASLGLYAPAWTRADYPDLPSVGRFESKVFEPETYKTEYPNPAFSNRLPDDTFWAAKQVMAFADREIRAIVETGQYSDPKAADWIVANLIARRDKIGRAYLTRLLPLDRFGVMHGKITFEDLAVKHRLGPEREYAVEWFRFDNETHGKTLLSGATGMSIPRTDSPYLAAVIRGTDARKAVTVYLNDRGGEWEVVGVERSW